MINLVVFQGVDVAHTPRGAPDLSHTPASQTDLPQPVAGEHTVDILASLNYSKQDIDKLLQDGVLEQAESKSKI